MSIQVKFFSETMDMYRERVYTTARCNNNNNNKNNENFMNFLIYMYKQL